MNIVYHLISEKTYLKKNKKKIPELDNDGDFENLIYHFKGQNGDINLNNFMDAETHYNKLKSHKIK